MKQRKYGAVQRGYEILQFTDLFINKQSFL